MADNVLGSEPAERCEYSRIERSLNAAGTSDYCQGQATNTVFLTRRACKIGRHTFNVSHIRGQCNKTSLPDDHRGTFQSPRFGLYIAVETSTGRRSECSPVSETSIRDLVWETVVKERTSSYASTVLSNLYLLPRSVPDREQRMS